MRVRSRVFSRPLSTDGSVWKALAAEIRAHPPPHAHPRLGSLYMIALAEGRRRLRTYHTIDEERRDDLVHDLLLAELPALLAATRPLTFFRVALRNRARSNSSAVVSEVLTELRGGATVGASWTRSLPSANSSLATQSLLLGWRRRWPSATLP